MLKRECKTLQKRDNKEMAFKTIGQRVVGVVLASKKAHITARGNHMIATMLDKVCSSRNAFMNASDMGTRKKIVQKDCLEAVKILYSRQKLGHRRMNTIRGHLTAVQAVICQVTEAIL